MSAIRVYRDGNSMCALIGVDLQEGEAEWESIEQPGTAEQQREAGRRALQKLLARLPRLSETRVVWERPQNAQGVAAAERSPK